ncbi:DEAD/DEAH box helicase [Nocardioides sp. YJ-D4]
MAAPDPQTIASTWGYHPSVRDLAALTETSRFSELLVWGRRVPDIVHRFAWTRIVAAPPTRLPAGIYWFSGIEEPAVLAVYDGADAAPGLTAPYDQIPEDSALDNALAWLEESWELATVVAPPKYALNEQVITSGGIDGIIKSRQYVGSTWSYAVFTSDGSPRMPESSLQARPTADDAAAWVSEPPASPSRFAATLTRAKLSDHFTDTVYSFRATRTIFRPYQFKPVLKLLATGALRLLIADEVGLGKTIEAGLVWTELEARRQADRVLVVCPPPLVTKWQREMEERFGFDLVELDSAGLDNIVTSLETQRVKKRAAYVCSINRLRSWDALERAGELGLEFDLVIVDEAHTFRNSDTKSFALGEELQGWAEALVMLSATPINLRTRDLYNLLSILVPGEFEDQESLEVRLQPNAVLNRVSRSLTDPTVVNRDRRGWLNELEQHLFGRILQYRPDFKILSGLLSQPDLSAADRAQVRRLCTELNALSAQISRTRKVEIQETKPLRVPQVVEVHFDDDEAAFYAAYLEWCEERAALSGTPLNFSMQMPLRLAGSCLPEAARSVIDGRSDVGAEESDVPARSAPDVPPSATLVQLAKRLHTDTKLRQLNTALDDLAGQGRQALVFTFSRRTLAYLVKHLSGRHRIAALHGGVHRRDRDRIMAGFRAGEYDFVLATKVASEGLDFEFCSAVVNYDLPWNPMEIEQRIGRIDRIGQDEAKIAVWNFATPGTIEEAIRERVHDRIGVFEHSIGELEPILESHWRETERLIFDFNLRPEQRDQRVREALIAIEEQARSLQEVEAAAPGLISTDGAEIDGLERDLLANGRYVGQPELAHLMSDWAETFGGEIKQEDTVLTVRGNPEMADHLQALARTKERLATEVSELASMMRGEQPIIVSLDQEASRTSGLNLLTATHVLTRAAVRTPGYRQARFTTLRMSPEQAGTGPGTYLTLLSVARWNGLRPFNEIWTASVDVDLLIDVGETIGAAVMRSLAEGTLRAGPYRDYDDLPDAADEAQVVLQLRSQDRETALVAENDAFIQTRRASIQDVHHRRMKHITRTLETNIERGNQRGIRLNQAKARKAEERLAAQTAELDKTRSATLTTEDLAVCVVEVIA